MEASLQCGGRNRVSSLRFVHESAISYTHEVLSCMQASHDMIRFALQPVALLGEVIMLSVSLSTTVGN